MIYIYNHATWAFKYIICLACCIVICLSQNCQKYIGWPCCFPGHPGAWLAMAPPPELRVETSLLGKRRRPVVDRQRGRKEVGGGGSLGFWHKLLLLQKKMHILYESCLKIIPYWSRELPLNNRKWISSWQELFSFASDRDESGREPLFCLISRTLERWTIFISWTHPNHSYYDEQELLSLILKITNLKQFLKWCKF